MAETWIIDVAHAPRGRDEQADGPLSGIHPPEPLAAALNVRCGRIAEMRP